MEYIPLESKIALINKYIQLNMFKPKDKSTLDDISENDIFTAIREDLKAHNETPEETKVSLTPTIQALKDLQISQVSSQKQLDTLTETLQSFREEQPEQSTLNEIIKELESFEKKNS